MIRLAKFIATCNKRYAYQVDYTNCNQKGHNYLSDRNILILHSLEIMVFQVQKHKIHFYHCGLLRWSRLGSSARLLHFSHVTSRFWGKTVGTKSQDCLTQYFPAINWRCWLVKAICCFVTLASILSYRYFLLFKTR